MRTGFLSSPTFWVRFATIVVVASVGLALAHLTWRLVGWDDGRTRIQTPETLAPVGGGAVGGGVAAILGLAPFGGGPAGADGLPASTLGLVLKGVIYSTSPSLSSALIAPAAGPAQTWSVGQTPAGNAVIESIEMDRVVLNVGGRREVLAFPQTVGTATATPAPGQVPAAAPVAAPPDPAAAASLAAASPIATAMAQRDARAAPPARPLAAQSPAATAAANPAAALSAAGVSATSDGYRIGPDAPAQLLRAGLRPGDLIRTLNGRPVSDLTSDSQLFERAASAGSARVELVRDGRSLTLTFPLR